MTDEADRWSFLDPDTQVDLTDVGLAGYELAESVDIDGRREFWVVQVTGLGDRSTDHGATEPPAHEVGGQLCDPTLWDRIVDTPYRCLAPRKDGQPCRVVVRWPWQRCSHHRATTDAER